MQCTIIIVRIFVSLGMKHIDAGRWFFKENLNQMAYNTRIGFRTGSSRFLNILHRFSSPISGARVTCFTRVACGCGCVIDSRNKPEARACWLHSFTGSAVYWSVVSIRAHSFTLALLFLCMCADCNAHQRGLAERRGAVDWHLGMERGRLRVASVNYRQPRLTWRQV